MVLIRRYKGSFGGAEWWRRVRGGGRYVWPCGEGGLCYYREKLVVCIEVTFRRCYQLWGIWWRSKTPLSLRKPTAPQITFLLPSSTSLIAPPELCAHLTPGINIVFPASPCLQYETRRFPPSSKNTLITEQVLNRDFPAFSLATDSLDCQNNRTYKTLAIKWIKSA